MVLSILAAVVPRARTRPERRSAPLLVAVIYTGSSVGSISGGWLSGLLIKRGWTVGKARMTTMLIAGGAACRARIFAYYTESFAAVCVALITLATALHQAWSANLFTNATDLFPQKVSGSVVGLGATAGGIGGMFMTLLVGLAVQWTGNQQLSSSGRASCTSSALALFWIWFRGRFDPGRCGRDRIDPSRSHSPLLISGGLVVLGGVPAALRERDESAGTIIVQIVKLNWRVGRGHGRCRLHASSAPRWYTRRCRGARARG